MSAGPDGVFDGAPVALPASGTRPRASRAKALAVAALLVAWLGVQLVVPALQLLERGGGPRPRPFGWQMFANVLRAPPEVFTITTANGRRVYDPRPLLTGSMRREVRYAPIVVPALCARPEVLAVEVADVDRGTTTVTCR